MADVFCNTSPLQYLHQVGQLDLLPELYGQVHIARAVVTELAKGMGQGVALPNVSQLRWATIAEMSSTGELFPSLGRGEAETIALGMKRPDALLVVDDRAARGTATAARLDVIGTVGVLLLAKERGLVETVGPVLDELTELGFRLSDRVRREALGRAGEVA